MVKQYQDRAGLKLLQVGPYPPPLGGWAFHIKKFQQYLENLGIENQVLNVGENRRKDIPGCLKVSGILDYIVKQLKHLQQGYVVYNHVDGSSWKGFILTIISQLLSLAFGRKAQLSFHAGTDQHCFKSDKYLYRVLARCCFHLSDHIVCNDKQVKSLITGFGKSEMKIHAIPCFSSQYLSYENTLPPDHEKFMASHTPLLFTYIFFRKGFSIEAIWTNLKAIQKTHPDVGMIVVGSLEGASTYLDRAKDQGVHNRLLLAGDVEHDTFLSLLAGSDLYLRTHLNDGVCSSVLEAVALGVPVVCSYNTMRPQGVVTYDRANAQSMLEKLLHCLDNLEEVAGGQLLPSPRNTLQEELVLFVETVPSQTY